jgi:hypothetical protein
MPNDEAGGVLWRLAFPDLGEVRGAQRNLFGMNIDSDPY